MSITGELARARALMFAADEVTAKELLLSLMPAIDTSVLRVLQSLVRDLAAGVLGRKFSAKDIPPSRALRLKCAPPPEGAGDGAPAVLRVDDGPRTDAPGAAAAKRSVVAEKDRRPGGKYAFFFDEKDRSPEFHFPTAKKA